MKEKREELTTYWGFPSVGGALILKRRSLSFPILSLENQQPKAELDWSLRVKGPAAIPNTTGRRNKFKMKENIMAVGKIRKNYA